MKTLITNYSFDKVAKTVTFNDYNIITAERILLIVDTSSSVIIYNFADSTKSGTVSRNILTLTYNTANLVNTDSLLIYYDDPAGAYLANIGEDTVSRAVRTQQVGIMGYDWGIGTYAGSLWGGYGQVSKNYTFEVISSGTSWTGVLEGALDGTSFTTILTHTNGTPGNGTCISTTSPTPYPFLRARISAVGNGTDTLQTYFLGAP